LIVFIFLKSIFYWRVYIFYGVIPKSRNNSSSSTDIWTLFRPFGLESNKNVSYFYYFNYFGDYFFYATFIICFWTIFEGFCSWILLIIGLSSLSDFFYFSYGFFIKSLTLFLLSLGGQYFCCGRTGFTYFLIYFCTLSLPPLDLDLFLSMLFLFSSSFFWTSRLYLYDEGFTSTFLTMLLTGGFAYCLTTF